MEEAVAATANHDNDDECGGRGRTAFIWSLMCQALCLALYVH